MSSQSPSLLLYPPSGYSLDVVNQIAGNGPTLWEAQTRPTHAPPAKLCQEEKLHSKDSGKKTRKTRQNTAFEVSPKCGHILKEGKFVQEKYTLLYINYVLKDHICF